MKAELAEAEEDMDDTVYQHEQEMKKYGYEQLQTEAETALENTLDALKKNTDFQQAVIGNMLNNVKANYGDVYNHLNTVIKDHGISVSETYKEMIKSVVAFNEAALQFTPPDTSVLNQNTSHIQTEHGGSGGNFDNVANSGTTAQTLKDRVRAWFDSLKDFNGKVPANRSDLAAYIMNKKKIANRNQFQELADILGIKTSGAADYDNWGKKGYKNQILKRLKELGFAQGGTVKKAMSMNYLSNMLQGAIIRNGDSGLITINPGETVLTADQTERLVTDVHQMQELVNRAFNIGHSKLIPNQNIVNNMNTVNNININVDHIANDIDIRNLADTVAKHIGKNTKYEMKKFR